MIFKEFIVPLEGLLTGSNFNRYYDPSRGGIHPRISVRVNVVDKERAEGIFRRTAERLRQEGKIHWFTSKPNEWTEDSFVVEAHEAATACILDLENRVQSDTGLSSSFAVNPTAFLVQLIFQTLEKLGFRVYVTWDLTRGFSIPREQLTPIASHFADTYKTRISADTADALERFLHGFFNCSIPDAEKVLRGFLSQSSLYQYVWDSRMRI